MTVTVQASETALSELRTLNLPARVATLQEKIMQINEGSTFEKAQKIREDFDRVHDQFNDLDDDFKDSDSDIRESIGPIRGAFKEKKDQSSRGSSVRKKKTTGSRLASTNRLNRLCLQRRAVILHSPTNNLRRNIARSILLFTRLRLNCCKSPTKQSI